MPTVTMMSWHRASRAAAAIFQVRKYAQMSSPTKMKNRTSPRIAFFVTSEDQVGPTVVAETLEASVL